MNTLGLLPKIGGCFKLADGLVLLLVIVILWGIRKAPKGKFFKDPLNREQGLALRGIFACVVVLGHLAPKWADGGFVFPRLGYWGPLAVSVFLVCLVTA